MLEWILQEFQVALPRLTVKCGRGLVVVQFAHVFKNGLGFRVFVGAWSHESCDHLIALVRVNLLLQGQVLHLVSFHGHLLHKGVSTADQGLFEDASAEDLLEFTVRNHAFVGQLIAYLVLNRCLCLVSIKSDSFFD